MIFEDYDVLMSDPKTKPHLEDILGYDLHMRIYSLLVLFPNVHGVRRRGQQVPNEFFDLVKNMRSTIGIMENFKFSDGAKLVNYHFDVDMTEPLSIPTFLCPYSRIRAEGEVTCDYITIQNDVMNQMIDLPVLRLNDNYVCYSGLLLPRSLSYYTSPILTLAEFMTEYTPEMKQPATPQEAKEPSGTLSPTLGG